MRKTMGRLVLIGAGAVGAIAVIGENTPPGRALRRGIEVLGRRARYAQGRLEGVRYQIGGRTPDPDVSDNVFADRIRSSLGRLEQQRDLPRIQVMVEDHVVLLHGEVPGPEDAAALEHAVRDVSGVLGVESYLHIGLGAGETRPSEGRAIAAAIPSPALRELMDAAHGAGTAGYEERSAVRAVLSTFADRIPPDEREQLFAHVPEDVRELAAVPRRLGTQISRARTVAELVAAVGAREGIDPEKADGITEAVLAHLRRLVPEEAEDVAAVLPADLREFWVGAVA